MDEEIIENDTVEEAPKPKRTRRKKEEPKPEPVEVETVEEEPKLIGYRARVKAGLLNVRERPSKASKVVSDPLKYNAIIQVVAEEAGWGRITNGYVMLEYIERID